MRKRCPKCGEVKRLDDFAKNKRRKDGLQSHCKACKKLVDAKHYRENKEKQFIRVKINKAKLKQEIDDIKERAGCLYCGESDPCCLDFHHTNKDDKTSGISSMFNNSSRGAIFEEIKKCEVVCANCHRKLHAGRLNGSVAEMESASGS